jgi:hypothetical protein
MGKKQQKRVHQGETIMRMRHSKELDALGRQVLFPRKLAATQAILAQVVWE